MRQKSSTTVGGEVIHFAVYYEIDGDTSEHALTLDAYGGVGVGSWVLLEESEESA